MGILAEPLAWVRQLPLPVGFSVCELGDQWVTCVEPHRLAASVYAEMGCGRYVSIDGNGRGTHTLDLNQPTPDLGTFDLVTDFGTSEHVFDQAAVWRTLHGLMKVGGYLAFDRPAQGYAEHCFYNVHRCLFEDVAAANGYTVMRLASARTKRGHLWRGIFRKTRDAAFVVPQQGRYHKALRPLLAQGGAA